MANIENKIVDRWQAEASNPFKEFQDNNPFVAEIPEVGSLDIEGIQQMLSDLGTVLDVADVANSLIYAAKGDFSEAALNALYAVPVLGNMKTIKKMTKGIEDRKFIKAWTNVLRIKKKYGEFPKKEQFEVVEDATRNIGIGTYSKEW